MSDSNQQKNTALKVLVSIINKCSKTLTKLKEDSWQYKWCLKQLEACQMVVDLLNEKENLYSKKQISCSIETLNLLINKCEITILKLKEGSSSHSLTKSRIEVFKYAIMLLKSI